MLLNFLSDCPWAPSGKSLSAYRCGTEVLTLDHLVLAKGIYALISVTVWKTPCLLVLQNVSQADCRGQLTQGCIWILSPFHASLLAGWILNISTALSLLSSDLVKLWLELLLINLNAFSTLIVLLLCILFIADHSLWSVEVELVSGMLTYHIFCIWFHGYSPINFFSSSHS